MDVECGMSLTGGRQPVAEVDFLAHEDEVRVGWPSKHGIRDEDRRSPDEENRTGTHVGQRSDEEGRSPTRPSFFSSLSV